METMNPHIRTGGRGKNKLVLKRARSVARANQKARATHRIPFAGVVAPRGATRNLQYLKKHGCI